MVRLKVRVRGYRLVSVMIRVILWLELGIGLDLWLGLG
jgi:hypothetical protein